jgi:DnaJ-class molecular chaperone
LVWARGRRLKFLLVTCTPCKGTGRVINPALLRMVNGDAQRITRMPQCSHCDGMGTVWQTIADTLLSG